MSNDKNAGQAAAAHARAEGEADGQQFVTFHVGGEVFAFPMADVREIIRVPEVVRIPLAPPTLEGMANLRGRVLPVVNLRRTFNFEQIAYDDSTRVVIVELNGSPVGFVVDRVASVISVEPGQMERVEAIDSTINADMLAGMIKGAAGHAMVMVLNPVRLVSFDWREEGADSRVASLDSPGGEERPEAAHGETSDERQLVSFVVAGQEYAFAIDRVQEIVQVPENISQVPNAQRHVLGVMTLRNRLLPLVSLREMFGLPPEGLSTEQRLVVISLDGEGGRRAGAVVGVVMDSVNEVLRVPARVIDELPAFFSRGDEVREIESICRLDEGRRVVSVISVERLFQHQSVRRALDAAANSEGTEAEEMSATEAGRPEAGEDDEEQLVVFNLAGEEYGVSIETVQEIIRVPETITRVPKTDASLEGVVNLRGQVLPAVDLRARFGLARMERDERQRIVVFSLKGLRAGFIVDSVSEVMKIGNSVIERVPSLSDEQARLMGRVANLEKAGRMILILDAESLLTSQDLGSLALVSEQSERLTEAA
jgi:purine-binding chemotaxis protein CheW